MKPIVLIVEDEKNAREGLGMYLEGQGYDPLLAEDGKTALELLRENNIEAVLTDLKMPGMDGLELLGQIQQGWPEIPTMMISAHGTVDAAVDAMKKGAIDFINKPVILEELRLRLEKIFKSRIMERQVEDLKRQVNEHYGFENIIGRSPAMEEIYQVIRQAADSRAGILLTGENGTGKELVAGAIHHNSQRRSRPFVKVNCGALSATLLESELFGHEKGAFTHAVKQRLGRFEMASGGTILLDEITEAPPEFQVKLLRVLQEGELERVGGQETIKVDVRVIAATNRDIEQMVKDGTFREDLYYRLNVIQIKLPPLRDRQEDIALLADSFIKEIATENNREKMSLSSKTLSLLERYHWPGNVRELYNVIEAAVVMSSGKEVQPKALPERLRENESTAKAIKIRMGSSLRNAEREIIRATLAETKGNRAKAARILDIGRKTLYRKIDEYELE